MHEWALAEAVISAASEIAEKEGLKEVTEVKLKVGELQSVDLEVLEFAFSELKAGKFAKAKFDMEKAKAKLQCRTCGNEWAFNRQKLDDATVEAIHFIPEVAHTYMKCPNCGSPDFEILEGRGVWLTSIKGAK